MKKTSTTSLILMLFFLFRIGISQTNSVSLKDGTGTIISSHASITDAYTAIPATLTQAYTIELTNSYNGNTETYPITFIAKAGASMVNSITLRPAAGVVTMSIQANVSGSPVINFNDADYVTIDGRAGSVGTGVLTIRNTATSSSANSLQLINGACFNIIRNCDVYNSTTVNTGRAVAILTSASNPSGNSDNLFTYCSFVGGRYQFNNSGSASNPNTRNIIYGCNFRNSYFAAYWGQAGSAKIRIDSCSFSCTTPIPESLYFGVLFDSQMDSAVIVNNRFYDIQSTSSTLRYIHIRSVISTGVNAAEIRNNFFAMTTGNTNIQNLSAIEISSGASLFNARIAHNSVRFGGTLNSGGTSGNVGSSALLISSTNASTTFSIQNNLFVNERSGGTAGLQHVAMAITNTVSVFNVSGNTYNSTSGNLTRWGSTVNTSIAAHQAIITGGEPTANNTPVQYVSANDLHIGCPAIGNSSLTATRINNITSDIDGNARPATTYRGADEPGAATTPTVSLTGQTDVTCNGLSNGSATVTATGGTGHTYNWAPAGGTSASASGLAAGNYTVTTTTDVGCTGTTTLTITEPAAIDASVTQNGLALTANTSGAGYQWFDCTTSNPVPGQMSQTYTATANGDYKVTVTVGGCSATSTCITIATVGMYEETAFSGLKLYPNPGTGMYTLAVSENAEVIVSNVIGEIILKQSLHAGNNQLNIEQFPNGIYSANISGNGKSSVVKIIKQ